MRTESCDTDTIARKIRAVLILGRLTRKLHGGAGVEDETH